MGNSEQLLASGSYVFPLDNVSPAAPNFPRSIQSQKPEARS